MTKPNTWIIRRVVKRLRNNLKIKLVFSVIAIVIFSSANQVAYAIGQTNQNQNSNSIEQSNLQVATLSEGLIKPALPGFNEATVEIKVEPSQDQIEAQAAANKAAAQAQLKKQRAEVIARSNANRISLPVGDVQKLAQERVNEVWGANQWPAFQTIVQRESGWVVGNKNRYSGACGLGQALPCSKMGSAYGNAQGEINWTIGYIKARYGTPQIALTFHNSHGWY